MTLCFENIFKRFFLNIPEKNWWLISSKIVSESKHVSESLKGEAIIENNSFSNRKYGSILLHP